MLLRGLRSEKNRGAPKRRLSKRIATRLHQKIAKSEFGNHRRDKSEEQPEALQSTAVLAPAVDVAAPIDIMAGSVERRRRQEA